MELSFLLDSKKMKGFGFVILQLGLNFITTFIFNRQLAQLFGISPDKDVFDIAFSTPYLISELVGLGFLHIIVTTTVRKASLESKSINHIVSGVLNLYLLVGGLLTLVLSFFSSEVISLVAPGFVEIHHQAATDLFQISVFTIFFTGISTVFSATLTALGLPISRELGLAGMRVFSIAYIFLNPGAESSGILIYFLIGLVAVTSVQFLYLKNKFNFQYIFKTSLISMENRSALVGSGYFVVAAITSSLFSFNINRLASFLDPGTIATISYSSALIFPLSILIGKPVGLVLGPHLILNAKASHEDRRFYIRRVLLLVFAVFGISSVLSLFIFAATPFIAQLFYGGGNFDQLAHEHVARTVRYLLPALPFASLLWVLVFPLQSIKNGVFAAGMYIFGNLVGLGAIHFMIGEVSLTQLLFAQILVSVTQALVGLVFFVISFSFPLFRGKVVT